MKPKAVIVEVDIVVVVVIIDVKLLVVGTKTVVINPFN
jgi:hypothetical protein